MTIDPRLYEKVTGRMPGDAMKAYGEALAKNEARKSKRSEDRFVNQYGGSPLRVRNPIGLAIYMLRRWFLRD